MTVEELTYLINSPVKELVKLDKAVYGRLESSMSYDEFCSKAGSYIDNIYSVCITNDFTDLVYCDMDNLILIENVYFLIDTQGISGVEDYIQSVQKLPLANRFTRLSGKYGMYMLNNAYEKFSDDELKSVFRTIYSMADVFDQKMPEGLINRLGYEDTDSTKKIKIYRGMGTKSCPLDKALSWTTDFGTALFFAIRSGCGCCVYSAEVPENRIVMRMHNHSEHEVLVRHKDLQNIRKENIETYADMSEMVEEVNSVMFYFLDTLEYRKRAYSYLEDGIHGRSHMLRVLFYTILYCKKMDMDYDDVFILSLVSIFHDIGRADDSENSTHGAKAVRIIRKDGLLEGLYENMKSVVEFIITYHCVSDGKIKFDGQDKEVELLKIFKDMDCLDRCRFCLYRDEFDVKYMRNKEAVEMLLKAGLLFSKKVDKFLGGIDDERQSDYS